MATFRIHGPAGVVERAPEPIERPAPPDGARARHAHADEVPITEIMTPQVVCAYPDLDLKVLIDVMIRDRLGCVPIVDDRGQPIGMITKLDIVEHLAAPAQKPDTLVADVMMPLAITIGERATVAEAAALMSSEDTHHLMIVAGRRLVGLVSTMDITRWLARNDWIN
jgi:CBS domain-containing protein